MFRILLPLLALVPTNTHCLIWNKFAPFLGSQPGSSHQPYPAMEQSPYQGQYPIHSQPEYGYNWNNYQQYPTQTVLFPASQVSPSSPSTTSAFPSIGSSMLTWWYRPWLSWKLAKLGSKSPFKCLPASLINPSNLGLRNYGGTFSPCGPYWSQPPSSNLSPCVSPTLCCEKPATSGSVIHTTVHPTYQSDNLGHSYPSSNYIYHTSDYKSSLAPSTSASDQSIDAVAKS